MKMLTENEIQIYNNQIKMDEDKLHENILIDNKMLIHENINTSYLPCICDEKEKKYDLKIKLVNMIRGLCITNELICESNKLFSEIKNKNINTFIFNTYSFTKLDKLNEYIIYDLKKYIDEVISITWLLKQDHYVENLAITSIGTYINQAKNTTYFNEYNNFLDFFELLNDLDNAFKHSFSNSLNSGTVGIDKNCIVVFYSRYGKKIMQPEVKYIILDDLIKCFNEFYNFSFNLIETL